jgi:hypothetical protein
MKRTLIVVLFAILSLSTIGLAAKKKKGPCAVSLAKCPIIGCGGNFDKGLNRRKNIRSDSSAPIKRSIQWMKNRTDPTNYVKNGSRAELASLGEGAMITVVAKALVARKGSAESCNCGLTAAKDTDNHIVMVDPSLATPTLAADEEDSETAEFTPRVRLDHPNLAGTKLQALIQNADNNALLVRVTGLLMFDSEHFLGRPLKRHNNWEIHPVMKLEFCETGNNCTAGNNAGWKSLDDQ